MNQVVTISKGIAILLMVIAHAGVPATTRHIIYSFHMPLFFILSGYCFKSVYLSSGDSMKKYFLKKFNGQLLKYFAWCITFILLHNFFYNINFYNETYSGAHLYSIKDILKGVVGILLLFKSPEPLIGQLWFLKILFLASIFGILVLKIASKISKKESLVLMGGGICLIISVLLSYVEYIQYAKLLKIALYSTSFWLVGYYFSIIKLRFLSFKTIIFVAPIVVISSLIIKGEIIKVSYMIMIPYYLTAIVGTWIVVSLSYKFYTVSSSRIKDFIVFIGENTMVIFLWHMLSYRLVSIILVLYNDYPLEMLACHPVISPTPNTSIYYNDLWWFYSIAGIFVPIVILVISRKLKRYNKIISQYILKTIKKSQINE